MYVFDLDGTLYRGSEVVPGAVETLTRLRGQGSLVRFFTNNSTLTQEQYETKLRAMGFEAHASEVASSATGAARYLSSEYGSARFFLVGQPGLRETLTSVGHREVTAGELAQVVVCGLCRSFDYRLLDAAMQQVRGGAEFVATNLDATFPVEGGRFQPGAGSLAAALATCTGQGPKLIGKPEPAILLDLLAETGVPPGETLVVGDRLDTDIECGRRAGCQVHLVLSGVAEAAPPEVPSSLDLTALV